MSASRRAPAQAAPRDPGRVGAWSRGCARDLPGWLAGCSVWLAGCSSSSAATPRRLVIFAPDRKALSRTSGLPGREYRPRDQDASTRSASTTASLGQAGVSATRCRPVLNVAQSETTVGAGDRFPVALSRQEPRGSRRTRLPRPRSGAQSWPASSWRLENPSFGVQLQSKRLRGHSVSSNPLLIPAAVHLFATRVVDASPVHG